MFPGEVIKRSFTIILIIIILKLTQKNLWRGGRMTRGVGGWMDGGMDDGIVENINKNREDSLILFH